MSRRTVRLAAATAIGLPMVAAIAFVLGAAMFRSGSGPLVFPWPVVAAYGGLAICCTIVGGRIVLQQSRHAIGWLLCLLGGCIGAGQALSLYANHGLFMRPALPGALIAALVGHVLLLGMNLSVLLLFLFPTGRAISDRWQRTATLGVIAVGTHALLSLVRPGPLPQFDDLRNPLALTGTAGELVVAIGDVLFLAIPITFALAVWSLIARYRRAVDIERLQLRWFAFSASLVGSSLVMSFTFAAVGLERAADIVWYVFLLTGLFVPVAVGVAISRYRLYEIDRIVSRTLGYALTMLILATVYTCLVLVIGGVLRSLTGEDHALVVAASTLGVAASIRPIHHRVQHLVERRFNRPHYDSRRELQRFALRLRAGLDPEGVSGDVVSITKAMLQPAHLNIWLPDTSPGELTHEPCSPRDERHQTGPPAR